jgi:ParB-like chromosome segregation protein Spo0J
MTAIRNRIARHVRVRAGDLVPHELNPRTHSARQRAALAALYREIGFARSLLAYELPDGRLKLIDGHLRAAMDPDQTVEVEVLDVTDREARALLLAIDPLAQLAGYDLETLGEVRRLAEQDSQAVRDLWRVLSRAEQQTRDALARHRDRAEADEQFLIIIECSGEQQQVELLRRFQDEGLRCQAKVS